MILIVNIILDDYIKLIKLDAKQHPLIGIYFDFFNLFLRLNWHLSYAYDYIVTLYNKV